MWVGAHRLDVDDDGLPSREEQRAWNASGAVSVAVVEAHDRILVVHASGLQHGALDWRSWWVYAAGLRHGRLWWRVEDCQSEFRADQDVYFWSGGDCSQTVLFTHKSQIGDASIHAQRTAELIRKWLWEPTGRNKETTPYYNITLAHAPTILYSTQNTNK